MRYALLFSIWLASLASVMADQQAVKIDTVSTPSAGKVATSTGVPSSNGSLCYTWSTPTSGGTPGGTNGQLQYNNSGAFGGLSYSGLPWLTSGVSAQATSANVASVLTGGSGTLNLSGYTLSLASGQIPNNAANTTGSAGSVGSGTYLPYLTSGVPAGATSAQVLSVLGNSGVTANSYTNANITVDTYGRVTAAANGSAGGVSSFNTRTGAVTLANTDVNALSGLTPNGLTITTSTGTLTIANGKTFTSSNTLTLAGTDGSTLNIGTGGTLGSNAFTSTAYVPQTTTVNGHALSGNVTVTPTDLSLVIGTNVQAYNANLTTFAGITLGTGVATSLAAGINTAGGSVTADSNNLINYDARAINVPTILYAEGSSFTDATELGTPQLPLGGATGNYVQLEALSLWGANHVTAYNCAVGGDTTTQQLARYTTGTTKGGVTVPSASSVFAAAPAGVRKIYQFDDSSVNNDFIQGVSQSTSISNLKACIDAAHASGASVYFIISPVRFNGPFSTSIACVNQIIAVDAAIKVYLSSTIAGAGTDRIIDISKSIPNYTDQNFYYQTAGIVIPTSIQNGLNTGTLSAVPTSPPYLCGSGTVTGTGIPASTTYTFNGTTLTFSNNATATNASASLTYSATSLSFHPTPPGLALVAEKIVGKLTANGDGDAMDQSPWFSDPVTMINGLTFQGSGGGTVGSISNAGALSFASLVTTGNIQASGVVTAINFRGNSTNVSGTVTLSSTSSNQQQISTGSADVINLYAPSTFGATGYSYWIKARGTGPCTINSATTTTACTTTNGSPTVTITGSTSNISSAGSVTGTGIPAGTTYTLSGTTVTLSANATAGGTGVNLTFGGWIFDGTAVASIVLQPGQDAIFVNDGTYFNCFRGGFGLVMTSNSTGTATFNANSNDETIYDSSSTTVASLTITLPTTSRPGQIIRYATDAIVTSITMAGGTVIIGSSPTSAAVGNVFIWQCSTSGNWIRLQ